MLNPIALYKDQKKAWAIDYHKLYPDKIDRLFDLLHKLSQDIHPQDVFQKLDETDIRKISSAFTVFRLNPWWHRVWTI